MWLVETSRISYKDDSGERKDEDSAALLKRLLRIGDAVVLLLQVHDQDQL